MFDKLIDVLLEFIGLFKFWRVIPIHKKGVRLFFGEKPKELSPGLHFVWPFEIHNVQTEVVEPDWVATYALHITTLDLKTISVAPVFKYRITDITAWFYKNKESALNLHDIVRFCTADVLTDCTWDECMKKPVWTKIKNKIKDKAKDLGVEIEDFGLIDFASSRIIITNVNE